MATDICILLGRRIRELRKIKGWRQIDLSQHSGVHEVHISDLERGTREVGLRNLLALARALQVPLSELVKGLDDPGL
jgi:transcriptional regulator with XRE-family HTH domain